MPHDPGAKTSMSGANKEAGGGSVLSATLKVTLVVGALAYGVANWLSAGGLERSGLERIALKAGNVDEPLTTGSLRSVRHSPQVDPCIVLRP
jgi:type IV secretory pathway TrbL component